MPMAAIRRSSSCSMPDVWRALAHNKGALVMLLQNYYTYGYHDPEHSYNDSTYHDKETAVDWQNGWRLNADHLLVGGAEWRKITSKLSRFLWKTGLILLINP